MKKILYKIYMYFQEKKTWKAKMNEPIHAFISK